MMMTQDPTRATPDGPSQRAKRTTQSAATGEADPKHHQRCQSPEKGKLQCVYGMGSAWFLWAVLRIRVGTGRTASDALETDTTGSAPAHTQTNCHACPPLPPPWFSLYSLSPASLFPIWFPVPPLPPLPLSTSSSLSAPAGHPSPQEAEPGQ